MAATVGVVVGALAGVLVGAIVGALVGISPAHASCARPASPSPYAFVGTVISTEQDDRVATVITDKGVEVTVLGTGDTSRLSESFTSVDRRYQPGGRYEFHPTNAKSPYRDNACTATKQLAGPPLQPLAQREELLPDWLPVDEQAGPVGYLVFFVPLVAAALALGAVGRRALRRRAKTPKL